MFDVKKVQQEAEAEIAKERSEAAKVRIKNRLKQIAAAESVVANLRREYAVDLAEIGSDAT